MVKCPEKIFRVHVKEAYESIAEEFSRTRSRAWREVEEFLERSGGEGTLLLDAGCGNGRHMAIASRMGVRCVGVDISRNLIKLAKINIKCYSSLCSLCLGDVISLPFGEDVFDLVLCIAVLHHIPDDKSRINAIKEIFRVLKPGGKLLVSVWSRSAKKLQKVPQNVRDAVMCWGGKAEIYYHIFCKEELAHLAKIAGITSFRVWESNDNIWLEAEKDWQES